VPYQVNEFPDPAKGADFQSAPFAFMAAQMAEAGHNMRMWNGFFAKNRGH
jgi:hypothetical protein